jgi:hypothetical protein
MFHASCLAYANAKKTASACHQITMHYVQVSASNANFLQHIYQIKYTENHKSLSTQISDAFTVKQTEHNHQSNIILRTQMYSY